jgi:hypothetical protein
VPFASEAQRRYLWANEPEVARRWAHEYPGQKDLPAKVKSRGVRPKRPRKSRGVKT